jgi:hypothetical protein
MTQHALRQPQRDRHHHRGHVPERLDADVGLRELPPSRLSAGRSARRQRFTGIGGTLNRLAISPVAGPGLDQLRRSQPYPLATGPFCGGQPAAIGVPHGSGIAQMPRRHQSS